MSLEPKETTPRTTTKAHKKLLLFCMFRSMAARFIFLLLFGWMAIVYRTITIFQQQQQRQHGHGQQTSTPEAMSLFSFKHHDMNNTSTALAKSFVRRRGDHVRHGQQQQQQEHSDDISETRNMNIGNNNNNNNNNNDYHDTIHNKNKQFGKDSKKRATKFLQKPQGKEFYMSKRRQQQQARQSQQQDFSVFENDNEEEEYDDDGEEQNEASDPDFRGNDGDEEEEAPVSKEASSSLSRDSVLLNIQELRRKRAAQQALRVARAAGGGGGGGGGGDGVVVARRAKGNKSGFVETIVGSGNTLLTLSTRNTRHRYGGTPREHFNPHSSALRALTTLYNPLLHQHHQEFVLPRVKEDDRELAKLQQDYQKKLLNNELFDYSIQPPALPSSSSSNSTFPKPTRVMDTFFATATRVVVLVLSARNHSEARQAIRDTWGRGHAVLFVVGARDEPHNETRLEVRNITLNRRSGSGSGSRQDTKTLEYIQNKKWVARAEIVQRWANGSCIIEIHEKVRHWVVEPWDVSVQLQQEAERYGDLLQLPHPDKYSGLAYKLRMGLQWIVRHLEAGGVEWIVKADDDMVVRVATLQKVLLDWYNPQRPMVIGHIQQGTPVLRWNHEPWFEHLYPYQTYPPFALGSYGYVMSAPIAKYVASDWKKHNNPNSSSLPHQKDDIVYYQGEDTSLGIWLDQPSAPKTLWLNIVDQFFNNAGGSCTNRTAPWIIHGHYLTPEQIRACASANDDDYDDDEWPQEWMDRAVSKLATLTCGKVCLSSSSSSSLNSQRRGHSTERVGGGARDRLGPSNKVLPFSGIVPSGGKEVTEEHKKNQPAGYDNGSDKDHDMLPEADAVDGEEDDAAEPGEA